jgi:pimeloyl-ACP methyl ester carboxylesterase
MHGNCSSRIEAVPIVPVLLSHDITLFCFDFSGAGHSTGEYISLGWHEKDDLVTVIEYLRSTEMVTLIGLWGRSMGSVTALRYASLHPMIAGMVLDSPFSSLKALVQELVKKFSKMPKFIANIALKFLRKTIKKKADFDIFKLNPVEFA